jgi:hypothetical protein
MAKIKTMMLTAILNVKRISSRNGGNGTNIMTRTSNTRIGMAAEADGIGRRCKEIPKIAIKGGPKYT